MHAPVFFTNPITGKLECMPTEMVSAYVPYASELDLEAAAKVACIRDDEAAQNLLLSIVENAQPEIVIVPQGVNEVTAEPVRVSR